MLDPYDLSDPGLKQLEQHPKPIVFSVPNRAKIIHILPIHCWETEHRAIYRLKSLAYNLQAISVKNVLACGHSAITSSAYINLPLVDDKYFD